MAGGDGSQALVAGVASEHDVAFVCIPAGTRNHFALDLGIDRHDVVGALDAFAWGVDRKVDLARVNGRTFVNNVSLGVYAEIVKSEEYRGAKIATARAMLPELLGPNAAPLPIRISDPEGRALDAVKVVLVSNNPYHLDGLMGVGVRAHLDTGQLGVVAIEVSSAADAAALVSLDTTGQVKRYHGWHEWSAAELVVEGDGAVATGVDGESIELDAPLRFETVPGALRVRVVPWAEAAAPSVSKNVSRDVISNLWGVASGGR
jgi:diacylglycerol kinase family enzyme